MCIFGEIVNGVMHLNEPGHIVAWTWRDLPNYVPNGIWDAFVVMPNPVHGTIIITSRPRRGGFRTRPYGTRPYGTRPYGTRPYGTRPYGTRPYGTRPYGTRIHGTRIQGPVPTEPLIRPLASRGYGRDSKRLRMV